MASGMGLLPIYEKYTNKQYLSEAMIITSTRIHVGSEIKREEYLC